MNKSIRRVFLLTALLVLLIGLGTVSAADVSDNTTVLSTVHDSAGTQQASAVIGTADNNNAAEDTRVIADKKSADKKTQIAAKDRRVKTASVNSTRGTSSKSIKSYDKIVLTEDNYDQYFNEYGVVNSSVTDIELGSDLYNRNITFNSHINQFNNQKNYTLYNSTITYNAGGSHIMYVNNINIVNTDNRSSSIICKGQPRFIDFKHVNVYQKNNNGVSAVVIENINNPVYFEYCNFNVMSDKAVAFDINNANLYLLYSNVTVVTAGNSPILLNNSGAYVVGNTISLKESSNNSIILINNTQGSSKTLQIYANQLISSFAIGNDTIESVNSSGITSYLNFPSQDNNVTLIKLNITNNSIVFDKDNNIEVKVVDLVDKNVNEGTVTFKVNNEEIGTAKVENGRAVYNYHPSKRAFYTVEVSYNDEAGKYIQGVFSLGRDDNKEIIMNFTPYNTTKDILSEFVKEVSTVNVAPVNATVNNPINITATVTYNGSKPVNEGQLVFKVNDKTLRDNKGNPIYVNVENGVAVLENFNIPSDWLNQNLVLSAVYGETDTFTGARSNNVTLNIKQAGNIKSRSISGDSNTNHSIIVIDETNYKVYIKYNQWKDSLNNTYESNTVTGRDVSNYTEVVLKNIPVTVNDYSIPANHILTLINTSISGVSFHNNTMLRGGILKSTLSIDDSICNVTLDNITTNYGSGWLFYIKCDNFTLRNSRFNAELISNTIDWSRDSEPNDIPLYIGGRSWNPAGNNAVIENNNMTFNVVDYRLNDGDNPAFSGEYPTAYGIYITGNAATVRNNNIKFINKEGIPGWLYGIYTAHSNNTITGNNLTIKSSNYTAGIYVDSWFGDTQNSTIANNYINMTCGNLGYGQGANNEHVGYGITLTNGAYSGGSFGGGNFKNNTIINNTIIANGYAIYAIEGFGISNTTIAGNTIELNGTAVSGISVIGVKNNITLNDITVNGKDNKTYQSADYLTEQTTGINLERGSQNNVTQNTIICNNNAGITIKNGNSGDNISYNIISSENNTYAINIASGSNNINIINNTLKSKEFEGDESVLNEGTNITISNQVERLISNLKLEINGFIKTIGDNITINGIIENDHANPINKAKITLTINNEEPIQFTTKQDGKFTYTYTTKQVKNNITIKAEYNGGAFYLPMTNTRFFDVEKINTYIKLDKINKTTENTITITGKLLEQYTNKKITNQTITINTNNQTYTTKTDENGTFTATITTPATPGTYNITAKYTTNNKYDTTNKTTTYTIEEKDTKITINKINTTNYNNNINITGKLTDTNNNPINNATITITINNKNYNTTTNNGTYNINIKTDTIGQNNITATYKGSTKYNPTTSKTTFNVTKTDSIITADNMTGYLGNNITLNATIKDTNGNIISNGTIIIKLNNKTEGTTNITNGKITYNLNLTPERFGKEGYTITYVYQGSNTTNPTRTNTKLNITPYTPKIELNVNTTDYGDTVTMTVKITNGQNYNALSGNIRFKINGITYKINKTPYKVQVTNGTATLKFYASRKFIGQNNITILYSGNGKFNAISQIFTNKLHINQYKQTKIQTTTITTKIGQNMTIKANITDKNGKPLTKGTVAIKINGKTYGHAEIINGTITYTLNINPTKFSTKNYTITIKFGGKGKYQPTTTNTTLTITKNTPKITYTKTQTGTNTRITVKIADGQLKANNGTVGLKINGQTYKINKKPVLIKPENGTATFNIPTNNLKTNNNITITYSGDRQFNGAKQAYNNIL